MIFLFQKYASFLTIVILHGVFYTNMIYEFKNNL